MTVTGGTGDEQGRSRWMREARARQLTRQRAPGRRGRQGDTAPAIVTPFLPATDINTKTLTNNPLPPPTYTQRDRAS